MTKKLNALKAGAKRLRTYLSTKSVEINHATSLEAIAHERGLKDWNTLSAMAGDNWPEIGAIVTGTFIDQAFKGQVTAVELIKGDHVRRYKIVFEDSVDVVTFESFEGHRKYQALFLNKNGQSANRLGKPDGKMMLD